MTKLLPNAPYLISLGLIHLTSFYTSISFGCGSSLRCAAFSSCSTWSQLPLRVWDLRDATRVPCFSFFSSISRWLTFFAKNKCWILSADFSACIETASLVAQRLNHLPPMQKTRVQSLGREDPLEKEMVTHSSILAWRIPWTEESGRLQSTELHRVLHNLATKLLTSSSC